MRICAFLVVCCCQLSAANPKLFPVHDGEHCGFSDASGKAAIPPQFSDCGVFSEGLAPVQVDKLWGYIDENSATVIPPQFLVADGFSDGLAFVTLSTESKAVIDRQGRIVFPADYHQHGAFSEGLAPVYPVKNWLCAGDESFETKDKCPGGKGFPSPGEKWGYIDTTGALAISASFCPAGEFHEGLAYSNGGFIDHQGNKVIPGPFSNATSFVNGVAAVQVDFKTWGYIDKRGGWLALPSFDEARGIEEGRGLIKLDGKYGYVDTSGEYGSAVSDDDSIYFLVESKDKWTFIVKDIGTEIREGCKDAEWKSDKPFQTMFPKPLEW